MNYYDKKHIDNLTPFEKSVINYSEGIKLKSVAKRRQVASIIYDKKLEVILSKPGYNHNLINGRKDACCEDDNNKTLPTVIHAEENAIFNFLHKHDINMINDDTILLTTFFPCWWCAKLIVQSGITNVYFVDYKEEELDNELIDVAKYLYDNEIKISQIIK